MDYARPELEKSLYATLMYERSQQATVRLKKVRKATEWFNWRLG